MNEKTTLPKTHQWLFWLILAGFSTYFAEVFSGSDMFPFFHPWGIFIVVPLYGLHSLLLASLVYRAPRPRFSSLVFAGMIFGLYEAYMTKVLWSPPWGDALIVGGIAPIETLVLVFWWHAWFAFILPLVVLEPLLTRSEELLATFPKRIGRFLGSWRGLALLMVFGGVFQSINSPSAGKSLLSGISTTAFLVGLVVLWRRITRNQSYSMAELLPNKRQFNILLIPTGMLYLGLSLVLRPEAFPGWSGHLIIWILYGISILLLSLSQKRSVPILSPENASQLPSLNTKRWLLLAGIFPLAAVVGEVILAPIANPIALIFWFGGIFFGLIMFIQAVRQTFRKQGSIQHV